MNNPVLIPSIDKCVDIFGDTEGQSIHKNLLKFEFRAASSLKDQIDFIKEIYPDITVRKTIKLLAISNDRFYRVTKNAADPGPPTSILPSQQLLTEEEEKTIIQKIESQQKQNDCLSSKDIREIAEAIYKARTGIIRCFTRGWFFEFKNRYIDSIEKVKANCLEDKRAMLSIDDVNSYISAIEEMMQDPPHPFLLINFDETGFGRRPNKGKSKTVYVSKKCHIKPYWREQADQHHVSLVVAITAGCNSLPPLCLSTRKRTDPDLDETFFWRWGRYFPTPKGYMNIESMLYWVENVLHPYANIVGSIYGEDLRCVLIGDGLKAHFHEDIEKSFEEIGNLTTIPLPPHSSHISQMLDATVFSPLKKRYASLSGNKKFNSQLTKKLMRIKNAYDTTMTEELIRSGWEATGFHLEFDDDGELKYSFTDEFKALLRAEALHQNT